MEFAIPLPHTHHSMWLISRVGPEPFIYGVYTVFFAGKSPNIWSYTVHIYGSGRPYSSPYPPQALQQPFFMRQKSCLVKMPVSKVCKRMATHTGVHRAYCVNMDFQGWSLPAHILGHWLCQPRGLGSRWVHGTCKQDVLLKRLLNEVPCTAGYTGLASSALHWKWMHSSLLSVCTLCVTLGFQSLEWSKVVSLILLLFYFVCLSSFSFISWSSQMLILFG
jgi:hypothetical protein